MSVLSDFLLRNSVTPGGNLPLLHSTRSYHLKSIKTSNKLIARECSVFKPDKLNYFFVGRPAYKFEGDGSEAERWELPCCFIFDFTSVTDIKRVFPFDSGAHHEERYPPYIRRMPLDHFEASDVPDACSRMIGAFFGNTTSYFTFQPKDRKSFVREFAPGVFDAELDALHRLSIEKAPKTFDDRRFTIEVQSESDLDLTIANPLAVIAPSPYFDDQGFLDHVQNIWKALPVPYKMYGLSVAQYYSEIYRLVDEFFTHRGLL